MKRQRGYAMLIGLVAVLGLAGSGMAAYVWYAERALTETFTETEGQALSQFGVGLRGYVASVQANPALLPGNNAWNFGVDWLKPPTCNGVPTGLPTNPPEGFVPCQFTGQSLGRLYDTQIQRDPMTNAIVARTRFMVPTLGGEPARRTMTAERIATAALRQQSLPANGMFYEVWGNVGMNANGPHAPPAPLPGNVGRVLMFVSNAPSNDIWLRTDGTNRMLANLNAGGFSIANARDARFSGDIRVEGATQIDGGLAVTSGLSVLQGGVLTTETLISSVGRFASSAIYGAEVLTGEESYLVRKPDCSQAGNTPAIYTALQGTGNPNPNGVYVADSIYESRVDVQDFGTQWLVAPRVLGTRFGLQLAGNNLTLTRDIQAVNARQARIVVLTQCR